MRRIPVAVAAGIAVALLSSHSALAHVRTSGTGGRAQLVIVGQPLTVSGTAAAFSASAKASDPPIAVTATVSNPNGFHRWAHTVTAAFGSSSRSGCVAGDYQIAGSPLSAQRSVTGHGTLTASGITVGLVNGNCKNATVTLIYSVS